jgi:glycosyltransferase involved in cell wall biosynthesis
MRGENRDMRILHVTDCLNGGVYSLLLKIANEGTRYPIEQYLMWDSHETFETHDDNKFNQENFIAKRFQSKGIGKILELRKFINEYNIDLIHLHSSVSGFIGRTFTAFDGVTLYSAHGFSFEKTDVSYVSRMIFKFLEYCLQYRTTANVIYFPGEEISYKKLKNRRLILKSGTVLNGLESRVYFGFRRDGSKPTFLVVGRIANAKDPDFLLEIVKGVAQEQASFVWVGDGSIEAKRKLESFGVEVTGWKSHDEVLERIDNATGVIMCSAWEGGPTVMYEAISRNCYVLIRDIINTRKLGFETLKTPADFIREINRIIHEDILDGAIRDQSIVYRGLEREFSRQNSLDIYMSFGRKVGNGEGQ